jgi:uncharacterized protein (TIGR02001 family)
MKHSTLSCAAVLCALAFAAPAAKAETTIGGVDVAANIGFTSDYVFRGISQSDEGPAVQGGLDFSHDSGFYAGVWGSNVDFNDGDEASVEVDFYGGYSGAVNGFTYDVGAIYYAYPGADSDLDYDFVELALAGGYDFGVAALSAAVNYTPDYFGGLGDGVYYMAAIDVPLPHDFSLSGHVGHQTIDDGNDYTDWSLGVGYSLYGMDLSLAYHETDLDEPSECADGCDARIVAKISHEF